MTSTMFSTKHTDFIATEGTACPAKPAYPEACPAGRPSAKRGELREYLATKSYKKYKQYIFFLLSFFSAKIIKHGFILATEDSEVTENRITIP